MIRLVLFTLFIGFIISCKSNSKKEATSSMYRKNTEKIDSNVVNISQYLSNCNYLLIAFPLNMPRSFVVADSLPKDSIKQFAPFFKNSIKSDTCKYITPHGVLILKNNRDSVIYTIDFTLNCSAFIIQNKLDQKFYLMNDKLRNFLFKKYKSVENVVLNFNKGVDY